MSVLYHFIGVCLFLFVFGPVCVFTDFSTCDDGPSRNQIWASFTLSPAIIPVPGRVTASLSVSLNTVIDSNIGAEVDISLRVLWWWVSIPCVGSGQGVGSCYYSNLCAMLDGVYARCNGRPCRCPIGPGTYSFPNFQLSTRNLHPIIIGIARNTQFYIKIKFFKKSSGALLSCMETQLRTTG